MQVPDWWLVVSGICFAFSILLNIVLIIVAIVAWKNIGPLIQNVNTKVNDIGGKVTSIAGKAEDTVTKVHDRTTKMMGTAQEASSEMTRKVSSVSAALTAIFVTARVVGAIRGLVAQQQHHQQSQSRTDGKREKVVKL